MTSHFYQLYNPRKSVSGCSPSPCASLSEMPPADELSQLETTEKSEISHPSSLQNGDIFQAASNIIDDDPSKKHIREYLQSFERRNSDSSCLTNRSTNSSTCEKLNLADEIKKLSERLIMLSSINSDLSEYNETITNGNNVEPTIAEKIDESEKKASTDKSDKNPTKPAKSPTKPEANESLTNSKSKLTDKFSRSYSTTTNSDTTNSSTKYSRFTRASSVVHTSSNSYNKHMTNGLSERLKSLDETPNLLQRLGNTRKSSDYLSSSRNSTYKSSASEKSSLHNSSCSSSSIGSAPWPITNKRTKFRISQMSRDVPIGSPHTHRTVFLEEAVNTTKDCLLHLLEKYNESDARTAYSNQGRHQSIAVGYGLTDNLEYRSMNSLNHFFQRHAGAGTTVKKIQARIESKRKS